MLVVFNGMLEAGSDCFQLAIIPPQDKPWLRGKRLRLTVKENDQWVPGEFERLRGRKVGVHCELAGDDWPPVTAEWTVVVTGIWPA